MNELEPISIEDISPIVGRLQLTIVQLEKTLVKRDERIAELEAQKPLDEHADRDLAKVDGHLEGVNA